MAVTGLKLNFQIKLSILAVAYRVGGTLGVLVSLLGALGPPIILFSLTSTSTISSATP